MKETYSREKQLVVLCLLTAPALSSWEKTLFSGCRRTGTNPDVWIWWVRAVLRGVEQSFWSLSYENPLPCLPAPLKCAYDKIIFSDFELTGKQALKAWVALWWRVPVRLQWQSLLSVFQGTSRYAVCPATGECTNMPRCKQCQSLLTKKILKAGGNPVTEHFKPAW